MYLFFFRFYLISRIPTLTYLDDRTIEVDEKKEADIMYSQSKISQLASSLHGKKSPNFSNFAAIESATPALLHQSDSIGDKIKSYWEEVVKRSPFPNF